jgi:hypothetical protein
MPMLGAADVPFLNRCRSPWIFNDPGRSNLESFEFASYDDPVGVPTDDTRKGRLGIQTSQQIRHVGRTPQTHFFPVRMKKYHRGFLADAFRIAKDIAIQNQIPQHEHSGTPKIL